MDDITTKELFSLIGLFVFLIWGIAVFLFGRISVKHIEREMAKEDIFPPVWGKGIGGVVISYSMIIVFTKLKPTIFDFEAVRRHTRKKDKKLAVFLQISSAIFFVIIFTAYYLYASDS